MHLFVENLFVNKRTIYIYIYIFFFFCFACSGCVGPVGSHYIFLYANKSDISTFDHPILFPIYKMPKKLYKSIVLWFEDILCYMSKVQSSNQ